LHQAGFLESAQRPGEGEPTAVPESKRVERDRVQCIRGGLRDGFVRQGGVEAAVGPSADSLARWPTML